MEKGTTKSWTEAQERAFDKRLAACRTFAERTLVITIRDTLKYDGRTREGKRAVAQGRLRLATATDKDLEEMARLESLMPGSGGQGAVQDRLGELKQFRQRVKEKGIRKEELRA